MTQRSDQIAAALRRAVSDVLARGLQDARIRGLISVTKVTLSPDLAEATIGISVLPAEHAELTLHGLCSAASRIRGSVARTMRMRRVPRLHFRLDPALKRLSEIERALAAARDGGNDSNAPPHPEEPTT